MTERSPVPTWAQPVEAPATERQLEFIKSLQQERELTEEQSAWLQGKLDAGISKSKASLVIERLLALPKVTAKMASGSAKDVPDVPAGRYAVDSDGINATAFYRVARPSEGRWAGYVFVDLQVSDWYEPIRNHAAKVTILEKILKAGPQSAAERYGRELGKCGICGRTLTNDESRARGIGPICAESYGW